MHLPRSPIRTRFLPFPLWVAALLVFGPWPQTAAAAPFISEIFLPGSGATAVEVGGIGQAGAALLVLDAIDGRQFRVRRKFDLAGPGGLNDTAVLAEPGWAAVLDGSPPPGVSGRVTEVPAFSLPITDPVALVLFDGATGIGPGTLLGQPASVAAELAANPIVDWVAFGLGPTADDAAAAMQAVTPQLALDLGIHGLPRPITATYEASVLARPVVAGLPVSAHLLPGTPAGVPGFAANLQDFPASFGLANPDTASRGNVHTIIPEPGVASLCLLFAGMLGPRRRR